MDNEERLLVDDREVVITPYMYVRCDGGNAPLGHPAEFITLERGDQAVCKYCGRRFVHTGNPEVADLRARGQPYAA
jgi:uncharacterized Zn-finger protein